MTKEDKKGRGWYGDSFEHSLASKGYKPRSGNRVIDADYKVIDSKKKDDKPSSIKEFADKSKTKVGKLAKKGGEMIKGGYNKIKEHLSAKEDDELAEILEPDLRKSLGEAVQTNQWAKEDAENPDYTEEQLRDFIEKGTPKELLDAVRTGDVIDANGVQISDENQQELVQHVGDLKHDATLAKEYQKQTERELKEKQRYLKKKYKMKKDEINDKWDNLPESSQTDNKHNEFKHELEDYENKLKAQLANYKAYNEMMEDISKGLEEVYKTRKDFVKKLIK